MRNTKKRKSKKIIRLIISLILIITIIITTLLVIENFENLNPKKEIKEIILKDECSLMFDNILHQIKSTGNCQALCKNECSSRTLDFESSNFTEKEGACHECACYCK